MELWIRSQDKDFLIKVDNINLGYQNDENNKKINEARRLFTFVKDTSFTLGIYETEERALEVLDSIHSCIQTNTVFELYAELGSFSDDFNNKYNLVPVYQMPKE